MLQRRRRLRVPVSQRLCVEPLPLVALSLRIVTKSRLSHSSLSRNTSFEPLRVPRRPSSGTGTERREVVGGCAAWHCTAKLTQDFCAPGAQGPQDDASGRSVRQASGAPPRRPRTSPLNLFPTRNHEKPAPASSAKHSCTSSTAESPRSTHDADEQVSLKFSSLLPAALTQGQTSWSTSSNDFVGFVFLFERVSECSRGTQSTRVSNKKFNARVASAPVCNHTISNQSRSSPPPSQPISVSAWDAKRRKATSCFLRPLSGPPRSGPESLSQEI
mmetsp:Transcript_62717/g.166444  ORF Transcript_62717/g.166444 Transcript_62717/m.166444 type:complete len:273 (+) Transcript_62717:156-974(+)